MVAREFPLDDYRMGPLSPVGPALPATQVFDRGHRIIVDLAHVRVERLDTDPVLFSKVFKQFEDRTGQKYDYRYWAERENFFLREFLKKQQHFSHVVQPRHLISENEAAKQVLTCDAGITIANWLRVKPRYADGVTLSHPFQRPVAWLGLLRACLVALRQIHQHGIVHCDIKEDNICVPYAPYIANAPYPWTGTGAEPESGGEIHLAFERLKLIDFAFSIAQWMPLTQLLIINPEDRAPYQSSRLVEALRTDRAHGSPNAVQQLDYRVDLYSLGYMAGKIMGGGLAVPPGDAGARVIKGAHALVVSLQASDKSPIAADNHAGGLPHDGMIAEIDALLALTSAFSDARNFAVAGEWTTEEMRPGAKPARRTPLTPVAPPVPTPVALPAPITSISTRVTHSPVDVSNRTSNSMESARMVLGMALGLSLSLLAAWWYLVVREPRVSHAPAPVVEKSPASGTSPVRTAPAADPFATLAAGIGRRLHDDEDTVFQTAWSDLAPFVADKKPAATALRDATVKDASERLNGEVARPLRTQAYRRLQWMGAQGAPAAAEAIAAFEAAYDDAKKTIAVSSWWLRGADAMPTATARWMEDGAVLAAAGDRPAMLDQAYAAAYGRDVTRDSAAAVRLYLAVIARAGGADAASTRIRLAAAHGLAAVLNRVVEQKDAAAAQALQPVLQPLATGGAADMRFYLGLFSECVLSPRNLAAARNYYRQAAADPAWKPSAAKRLAQLGRSCPASSR